MAIEVGTLLTLPDRKDPLEITNVEHIIWSGPNGARHKACIFTKAAPDTREARRRPLQAVALGRPAQHVQPAVTDIGRTEPLGARGCMTVDV